MEHEPITFEDDADIIRELRDLPLAHYTFKVDNFSVISSLLAEEFQSPDFEVGGYKWRLSLYPNGNYARNGDGHISLYLLLSESNSLPLNREVNFNFRMFVYDHIRDTYLTVQDAKQRVKRFYGMKARRGFDHLVSLEDFNDVSKGYLVNDSCVFGVEISVVENTIKGGCLSLVKLPVDNTTYTWNIYNFAELDEEYYQSMVFVIGGSKWTLKVFPKGHSVGKDNSLSMFLQLEDHATLVDGRELYVEFTLRIRDQINGKHREKQINEKFHSSKWSWGVPKFMSLSELNAALKGFILKNTLSVEVDILKMVAFKEL